MKRHHKEIEKSIIQLLEESKVLSLLREAKKSFLGGDYEGCLDLLWNCLSSLEKEGIIRSALIYERYFLGYISEKPQRENTC